MKPPQPCINLYRINPAGNMAGIGRILLDRFPFCHDFALTNRYAIFFVGSIVFTGMTGFFLGTRSISGCLKYDPDCPMKIIVVDLDTLLPVREFETDAGGIIHFGNAYEDGEQIVVDGMYTAGFDNSSMENVFAPGARIGGGAYHRYRLNMATGKLECATMSEHKSEFPAFNTAFTGRANNATYTACSVDNGADSFFNGFQKVTADGETTLVTLRPGLYGSEPLFAPARGAEREDDGYLLEVIYDAYEHKSELQIYRADDVSELVCTLKLKHHLPHQFHGFFSPRVFQAPADGR